MRKSNQVKRGIDFIGDVHADVKTLRRSLRGLGYIEDPKKGFYHPSGDRQVIFVGDFINKGTDNLETLSLIKKMMDNKNCLAIIGNNEFDEIVNSEKVSSLPNVGRSFQEEAGFGTATYNKWVKWFRQLPVYYRPESKDFLVIHAQYKRAALKGAKAFVDKNNCLKSKCFSHYVDPKHKLHGEFTATVGLAVKGTELYVDESLQPVSRTTGKKSRFGRISWWHEPDAGVAAVLNMDPRSVTENQLDTYGRLIYGDKQWRSHFEKPDILTVCGHIPRRDGIGYTPHDKILCLDSQEGITAYKYNNQDGGKIKQGRVLHVRP